MNPMYRTLLVGTAAAAISQALAAQTVINTARTTPVHTATAANGQASDVRIDAPGSVTVTGGAAVTINSKNNVTNAGKIALTDADYSSGILVTGPRTADIVNTGSIIIDETYTPTDHDNDGDLDGPFAIGRGRTGIRIDAALTGSVRHSGTIVIEGNQSAGIRVTGPLTGSFTHDGKTSVLGDQSVGVALGDVSGDVRLGGEISAKGAGSQGAVLSGDVGGRLRVQGAITATGYRTVPAPSDTSRLDDDDLLQGGSALVVEGDVAKGIVFEDDGKDIRARVISYGSAPAVAIGATERDIAIGATEGTASGYSIILAGTVLGDGVYAGAGATGMRVGGRGGSVSIANGMLVNGTVRASARDANATGLDLAMGTSLPELRNSGVISASVSGTKNVQATALLIGEGASLPVLKNANAITATAHKDGTAYAILDRSGTLGLIENSGTISATGAEAGKGRNVAIDLSARSADTVIRQTVVGAGIAAPSIIGDIRFGSGSDLLDIADGSVIGNVSFGGGTNRMQMSGRARFNGTADFGGGAGSLVLANSTLFSGRLVNAQGVAVGVSSGTLALSGATSIASLDVSATGVIGVTLGGQGSENTAIAVSGNASFAKGALINVRLSDITKAEGSFTVISAASLSGAGELKADSALVPFLYSAKLAVAGNSINVDITRKDTAELGLNASETVAFDGLFAALVKDDKVAGVFLSVLEAELFQNLVAQTLPDHAGGAFEGVSQGMRVFDRHFLMPNGPFDEVGKLRLIGDLAHWNASKERGESAAFDLNGFGFRGGVEYLTGAGAFGVTGSWLWNRHKTPFDASVMSDSYEAGAHWRGQFGPVLGFARAGIGTTGFSGLRQFAGGSEESAVSYTVRSSWNGSFVSASGGLAAEGGSQFFFFRPSLVLDYLHLSEDGYEDADGGKALNLVVEARSSREVGLNAGLAAGFDLLGMQSRDETWLRLEAEAGWRELLTSDLGQTVARYGDGDEFTLTPEGRDSGWFARARALGGDGSYRIAGEVGLEEQFGQIGYSLRASLSFGW